MATVSTQLMSFNFVPIATKSCLAAVSFPVARIKSTEIREKSFGPIVIG